MKKSTLAVAVLSILNASAFSEQLSPMEETLVQGVRERRVIVLEESLALVPDSASLLNKAPGANFNSNGPLSGIAQIRGMFGPRVNTHIDGQSIGSGGPNWMDPPLSYAPAAQLQTLEVFRGIAPVSAGQETIGGAVHATTWKGMFGDSAAWDSQGRLVLGGKSVNNGRQLNGAVAFTNRTHKMHIAGLSEMGDDASFPGGDIIPSEYERQRWDAGYAIQSGVHQFQVDLAHNETGEAGTPALPMDIDYFDSDLISTRYQFDGTVFKVDAMLYSSDIDHGMTNYHLRPAPTLSSGWRQNIATADNQGAKLKITMGDWSIGADHHAEVHNSNIDNINNAAFFAVNFNDARRSVSGVFLEHDNDWHHGWQSHIGVRVNDVMTDADEVNGTPAMMMPAATALRDQFNQAERRKTDTNVDGVVKLNKTLGAWVWYVGAAQKTRSPSYQERYLWLPMEATAGLADGRTYTGNIDLKPEVAHELEFGFDYISSQFSASPRLFYREVSDYIQGTPSEIAPALMMASMMNTQRPLHFNNVDARFQGVDMDMRYQWAPGLSVDAVISYVEGERADIDDDLYRIAPLNGTFAVNLERQHWGVTLESVLYAGQDNVSVTQSEKQTAGYGLVNFRSYWVFAKGWQLAIGLDNVLDKYYQSHLTGYNRVQGGDIGVGERLPGYGRDMYLKLDYRW